MAVEAYQLEPLRRALTSPPANLLLADDVGLGKTIEAGLVAQELFLRHRARTAVIVCPPSLSLKWQDEMRDKFGLQFVIVNSELMAQVRRTHGLNANPFQLYPRVFVSMAWLPQVRCQRLLRDVYAQTKNPKLGKRFAFDVLVVDDDLQTHCHRLVNFDIPFNPSRFEQREGRVNRFYGHAVRKNVAAAHGDSHLGRRDMGVTHGRAPSTPQRIALSSESFLPGGSILAMHKLSAFLCTSR